ncbi:MAG: ankyrin repeat domain-containing protein [Proteobacteria bacterium]|nr:ankyrin repeat domain-containing protein [Pseudomonadota bacterium]
MKREETYMRGGKILAYTLAGIFGIANIGYAQMPGEGHRDNDFMDQRAAVQEDLCNDMTIDVNETFLQSARLGAIKVVKCLSRRQSFEKSYADKNEMNALMWASRGHTGLPEKETDERNQTIDFLVDEIGMDVHAVNKDGAEALATAAATDNLHAAKRLVEKGADIFRPDSFGMTPYDEAVDAIKFAERMGGIATTMVKDYFDKVIKEKGLVKPDSKTVLPQDRPRNDREMHELLLEEMQKEEPPASPVQPKDKKFEM